MAKRVKPDRVTAVKDLNECDRALARVAQIKRWQVEADAKLNEEIDRLKTSLANAAAPLKEELVALENGIEAFGEGHKAELFADHKTVELAHGFLGFRISTALVIGKKTLGLLKQFGWGRACVRVKESVDKEELAKRADKQLAEVGAKRVSEDRFWYEVKEEEVAQKTD